MIPEGNNLEALLLTLASGTTIHAQDWPQWRGPAGNNVSQESDWNSTGQEQPLWSADIGWGYSSPSSAAGRLFIAAYFGDEATPGAGEDRITCLDAATGAPLWSHSYPADAYDNEQGGSCLW